MKRPVEGDMKIAIVGAGNAGCITALHYHKFKPTDATEIEIYHDPDIPIERVGQGTIVPPTELIGTELGINWDNNIIDATLKTGFMYEGWGKKTEKIFHDFRLHTVACHYVPQKLSNAVLGSGKFKVIEKKIRNPEREIDADYIFDCRGKKKKRFWEKEDYKPLINPLNAALLFDTEEPDPSLHYTRCVATPNGWTFIIPNKDSLSYGYLYNDTITTKEDATEDFLERFNLPKIDGELQFENYVAKDIFVGERTILNGNRAGFVEPMEATALEFYHSICRQSWDHIIHSKPKEICNNDIQELIKQIETFILWHYQSVSKFDTPFWDYARSLPFNLSDKFSEVIFSGRNRTYGQWDTRSAQIWQSNI